MANNKWATDTKIRIKC